MSRELDEQLVKFCTRQSVSFDTGDWVSLDKKMGNQLVRMITLLLLGGNWYGHKPELEQLAQAWSLDMTKLPEMIQSLRFDCPRFISMLKRQMS